MKVQRENLLELIKIDMFNIRLVAMLADRLDPQATQRPARTHTPHPTGAATLRDPHEPSPNSRTLCLVPSPHTPFHSSRWPSAPQTEGASANWKGIADTSGEVLLREIDFENERCVSGPRSTPRTGASVCDGRARRRGVLYIGEGTPDRVATDRHRGRLLASAGRLRAQLRTQALSTARSAHRGAPLPCRRACDEFGRNFAGRKDIKVPRTFPELSTSCIMTMECAFLSLNRTSTSPTFHLPFERLFLARLHVAVPRPY